MATNKPADISSKIWAALGDVETPTDAKMETGWVAEVPKAQVENWVQNRQDAFNAHVNERGIAEWDATTDYIANKSYVQGSNGLVYVANQNTGPSTTPQDPTADNTNTYWRVAFQDKLVSGSNIKTINGSPVLGGGNLVITGSSSEASNIGSGEGVFAGKDGDDLQFKSLVAGDGVSISSDTETITITADGGGGGSQTDLGIGTRTDTTVEVTSSTGSSANLPAVTSSLAGVMTAADKVKLDNANLTALAGLTGEADRLPYFTGAGALSLTTLTAAARTLLTASNVAGQRSALGLGTAATATLTTSTLDSTAGRVLKVGDAGILGTGAILVTDWDTATHSGAIMMGNDAANAPTSGWYIGTYWKHNNSYGTQIVATFTNAAPRIYVRSLVNNSWGGWIGLSTGFVVAVSASRSLTLVDAGAYIRTTAATTITVPTNATAAFVMGTEITIRAAQASGNTTVAAASGVTLVATAGAPLVLGPRMTVTLKKVGTDTWDVIDQTSNSVPNASPTVVGGLKVRLDGTTLYMTNDGSDA